MKEIVCALKEVGGVKYMECFFNILFNVYTTPKPVLLMCLQI